MEGEQTLYVQDDTGAYTEYTPPETPAFKETLPEDLRGSEHLSDVEDGAQLARYYVDLKSNYLKPPENADGYEFEKPEDFHLSDEQMAEYKNAAFENGYNQKQFEQWMKFEHGKYQNSVESLKGAINNHHEEGVKALKTEWGDNYDTNVEKVHQLLKHEKLTDEGFIKFLDDTRFGDNPQVLKYLFNLSQALSEDAFVKPDSGSDGTEGKPKKGEDGRPMLSFPSMQEKSA